MLSQPTSRGRWRLGAAVEALEPRVLLSTFTVTSADDSGAETLRQAILDSNAAGGTNEIDFAIGSGGLQTIDLQSPLPVITTPVYINGASQPGYSGTPLVELSGWGLSVSAGHSTIRGLCIHSSNLGALITLARVGGNVIEGNYLGTDPTGSAAAGNSEYGIYDNDTANNLIGGTMPGEGNVISGSKTNPNSAGVLILGNDAIGNQIEGNFIGTDASGAAAIGNRIGVEIEQNSNRNTIGGTSPGAGNVISGNFAQDIFLTDSSNRTTVQGNLIGLNASGTTSLSGNNLGIDVSYSNSNTIGGTSSAARNVISGHQFGIYLYGFSGNQGSYNIVEGNYIGADVTGEDRVPNVTGAVINSRYDTFGGKAVAAGNLVSGNLVGVQVARDSSAVIGNDIGLSASGAPLGNIAEGVLLSGAGASVGGTAAGSGNVICGNGVGVVVTANGTFVQGNFIGTNAASASTLGNGAAGVSIQGGSKTQVGGAASGAANTIAYNRGDGIDVTGAAAVGNTISRNLIYANGGIGIDLGADGPTPNHVGGPIAGPNEFQNYPVLRAAALTGHGTTISGSLNGAAAATYTLEFFANPPGAGSVQGAEFLGSANVTTDTTGNAPIALTVPTAVGAGQLVTATATDAAGNTSEFSGPATATDGSVVLGRYAFYNDSGFDGNNAVLSPADDGAIATDKQALLPGGGPATFQNYTSYSKGINGIMVDVAGPAVATALSDFTFQSGDSLDPSQWPAAPAPTGYLVRPGAGVNGSTRVEISWADHAIQNEWLAVTVVADSNTGLASSDTFYFGNLAGASGKPPTNGQVTVTAADETAARNDPHGLINPAAVTNPHDYDRDGKVNAVDQIVARYDKGSTLAVLQPAVGSAASAVAAADAGPTPQEQYMLELINRARANPAAEAALHGIDLNEGLPAGTLSPDPRQPLAFNPSLIDSARSHSQWMLANQTLDHNEGNLDPATRMQNAGYVFNPLSGSAENIAFSGTKTTLPLDQVVAQEQRDLFVDSSVPGRGHRLNLLDGNLQEVGIGITTGLFRGYNAVLTTQDFAFSAGNGPFLTGVAYTDALLHDHFYEPGEGIGEVTVTATRQSDGASFSTTTWSSGGYTLPLPAGTYTVVASGGVLGTVTDPNIMIGSQNVTLDFTPPAGPYIAGRYVFYNHSAFDGNDPALNPADDRAIATDKQPLLSGLGPATFTNVTNYSKGINGIMIDIGGLPAGAALNSGDFSFAVGNVSDVTAWQAAPTPVSLIVRPGAGNGGSARVEFAWADHAIQNEWLQVTVSADADTGLLLPDVFYFGNLVGSSGGLTVTRADEVAARSDLHGFTNPAGITNVHDYNRDGRVDAVDQLIARRNVGGSLVVLDPPPPAFASAAVLTDLPLLGVRRISIRTVRPPVKGMLADTIS